MSLGFHIKLVENKIRTCWTIGGPRSAIAEFPMKLPTNDSDDPNIADAILRFSNRVECETSGTADAAAITSGKHAVFKLTFLSDKPNNNDNQATMIFTSHIIFFNLWLERRTTIL